MAYTEKESKRYVEAAEKETERLVEEFGANNIDFVQEILPRFEAAYLNFVTHWPTAQAVANVREPIRRGVKRCKAVVAVLVEEVVLFPQTMTDPLQKRLVLLQEYLDDWDSALLEQEGVEKKIIDRNLTKNP